MANKHSDTGHGSHSGGAAGSMPATGQGTGGHGSHHIVPFETYIKVFATLILLTAITVGASRVDFGAFNAIVAFAIATVKALFVALIFMHLKYDDKMNRIIIVSAFFFLLVLWFFSILDEMTRIVQHSTL
jgi:cytochrome c oxidase subunit 4